MYSDDILYNIRSIVDTFLRQWRHIINIGFVMYIDQAVPKRSRSV